MAILSRADVLSALGTAAGQAKMMHETAEAIRRKSAVLAEVDGEQAPLADRDELGRSEVTLGTAPARSAPGP